LFRTAICMILIRTRFCWGLLFPIIMGAKTQADNGEFLWLQLPHFYYSFVVLTFGLPFCLTFSQIPPLFLAAYCWLCNIKLFHFPRAAMEFNLKLSSSRINLEPATAAHAAIPNSISVH